VPDHQLAQTRFGITYGARRQDDVLAHPVQAVGGDLEEQRFLALEVVVEPRFRDAERAAMSLTEVAS
jgi:hypothetical protein